MKVLLITEDLYKTTGGGQTVYKKIIESNPEIEFHYFLHKEAKMGSRPKNSFGIPVAPLSDIRVLSDPPFPSFLKESLQAANRYASAVAGQSFDIVDVPDFLTVGGSLRDAFAFHQVSVKRVILALHGNISDSIELSWDSPGDNVHDLRMLEQKQYVEADGAYGISPRYLKKWKNRMDRPIHFIDPRHFITEGSREKGAPAGNPTKPSLYCIGRTERLKGNDLFIELIRWIDPSLVEQAVQIGDEVRLKGGRSSLTVLSRMARLRRLDIKMSKSRDRRELMQLFEEKSVVVLPVRHDSLNLVALEAIFNGCPLVVSAEAGVCDYLDTYFPNLPYLRIDLRRFYQSVVQLTSLIREYDSYRERLELEIATVPPIQDQDIGIKAIYEKVLAGAPSPSLQRRKWIRYKIKRKNPAWESLECAADAIERVAGPLWKKISPIPAVKRFFAASGLQNFWEAPFLDAVWTADGISQRLQAIAGHGEISHDRQREKLLFIYSFVRHANPIFRCNCWLDIARLERSLGNDLVAATYELRALRLIGRDPTGLLPRLLQTLETQGFKDVAAVADIMYTKPDGDEALYRFLKSRYDHNRSKNHSPLEKVWDERAGAPKVSVIVSLYRAASKLDPFLTCLVQQTLMRNPGAVEIIFVDSASPDREQAVLRDFIAHTPLNMVYVRSTERETIQAAWNRGIELARGEYLVFLGVDETLYPEALETLAGELDRHSGIDWVMADSLVTSVDEHGTLNCDVMPYARSDATKDMVYLDTCYVSWVGGMYRKTIHPRFGYYDETFGAAGDTEFKSRLLPHLKVRFLPRMLGLFLDYPETRTTASYKAEIEDFRAWYIHRTPAGVRYAFENRPVEDAENLFFNALGYRKSYCTHLSSDVELATYLAEYLVKRQSTLVKGETAARLRAYLRQMQDMEYMDLTLSTLQTRRALVRLWRSTTKLQAYLKKTFGARGATFAIRYFNDNRFEQHSNLWTTVTGA